MAVLNKDFKPINIGDGSGGQYTTPGFKPTPVTYPAGAAPTPTTNAAVGTDKYATSVDGTTAPGVTTVPQDKQPVQPAAPAPGAAIAGAAAGALGGTGAVEVPQQGTQQGAQGAAPSPAPTVGQAQPPVTNNGAGSLGGTGGGSSVVLPGATDYSDMINELYAMQQEQMLAQAQAQYDAAIAELEHNGAKIPGYYQEAVRQTAGQNEIERRAMNEQFAASGLNTGTRGQAALAQSVASQGEIAALRQAEADALAEIEFSRAQMMAEYQAAVRDAILSNNIAKAEALYNEALRLDEAAVQTALSQAQLDYQARMEELAALEARAEMLASIGDYSGYAALGYSAEEIAALQNAWQQANGMGTTGGGYTGGGYDYSNGGMSAEEIRAIQAQLGVTVDGLWGPETEAAYQAMISGLGTPVGNVPALGTDAQNIYNAIASGQVDGSTIGNILSNWLAAGRITEAEADYLLSLMGA